MSNSWVQIIGTFLIGGGLLKFILPLYISMFGMCSKPNEVNELCITLGGKIHRKWFFFNILIYIATLIILAIIGAIFMNWVMIIILIPYFIALFLLFWGNFYKRLNAITDNHKVSVILTCTISIFGILLMWLKKINPEIENMRDLFFICVYVLLFFMPTKKLKNKENADIKSYFNNILTNYKENFNNYVFDNIIVPTVLEHFEKNKDFYIKNEHFITNEKEINTTELEKHIVQLLLKTIDIKLTSGDYHIYFGVLDDRGQELLKLYKLVIKEFIRLGILDENTQKPIDNEWCERNIKSLIDDIKTIG